MREMLIIQAYVDFMDMINLILKIFDLAWEFKYTCKAALGLLICHVFAIKMNLIGKLVA